MPRISRLAAVLGLHTEDVPPPTPEFDPILAHTELLNEREGYFKHAGGDGGQGGTVVYVANLNDSGAGSLRSFLTATGSRIILFEDGLNGVITLTSQIEPVSNKTVWGRHRDGTAADIHVQSISSSNIGSIFEVRDGQSNFIFANLKGSAQGPLNDFAPDWIEGTRPDAGLVWVHHVSAIGDGTDAMDGFVDWHTQNLTVSWCKVTDWSGTHIVTRHPPETVTQATLSIHHTLYRSCRDRLPKVGDTDCFAHCWNNWCDNWDSSAMKVTDGEGLFENNIFDAGTAKNAIDHSSPGKWGGSGNLLTNGATQTTPQTVFTPPYSYTLDPLTSNAEQDALRNSLEADAGWQSSF